MNPEQLLQRLVEIPSPTGQEADAVRFLQEEARRDGFRVVEDAVGNFIAEAGRKGPLVLFVGHIDTVPGHIPVRVEKNEVWGRGAVDAKGSLVAFYAAARGLPASSGVRVRIVGAVDEEGLSRGANAIPNDLAPAAVLIGEPSGADTVTLGYKGIVRGRFEVRRERVHGAHPQPSAADELIRFWSGLCADLAVDGRFDGVQARLDHLSSRTDHLHDVAAAEFNLRIPWGRFADDAAARLEARGRTQDVEVEIRETVEPAQSGRANSLVAAYVQALRRRGSTVRFTRKSGTSDFALLQAKFPGIPILAYGPGDAALDHTPHERLPLDELRTAIEVHRSALATLPTLLARPAPSVARKQAKVRLGPAPMPPRSK